MYKRYIKRILDFTLALFSIIFLSPLLITIIIWLHFANKGAGVFFTQDRPGKDAKVFKVLKFKSMTDRKDAYGNLLPDKDRITKVGKFMRKTSIDELPQLFNVLKGDMAIIGPRPLLPEYLPWYTPTEMRRHEVRPGISGLAQTHGRNNMTWEEIFADDVYYVDHISLGLDLKIIINTVINVLRQTNITVVPPGGTTGRLDLARAEQQNAQEHN